MSQIAPDDAAVSATAKAEIESDDCAETKRDKEERKKSNSNGAPHLQTSCLAGIRPQPVRWLVPGYLPLGKVIMLAGDGGHGKSTLTLNLAACVSTGRPWLGLDYAAPPAADVLLISCEDDFADTVVPRLLSADADLSRIDKVDAVKTSDGKFAPFNLNHFEELKNKLKNCPSIQLVVIDPCGAYIGRTGIDEHKDADLRSLLDPLNELAAEQRVTFILVKHLVKGATALAVHKVSGSAGYTNAVRGAFIVAPSREEEAQKLLLPIKFNLGAPPPGRVFRLLPLADEDRQRVLRYCADLDEEDRQRIAEQLFGVCWEGESNANANDLFAETDRRPERPNNAEKCAAWLREFLAKFAYPDAELRAAAEEAGFTERLLKSAKGILRKEEPRLEYSNKGAFHGAWWNGLGSPDSWIKRPEPAGVQSVQSVQSGQNPSEKAAAPPRLDRLARLDSHVSPTPDLFSAPSTEAAELGSALPCQTGGEAERVAPRPSWIDPEADPRDVETPFEDNGHALPAPPSAPRRSRPLIERDFFTD